MKVQVKSLKDLEFFAEKLGSRLTGGEVISLTGDLGAGKTAFTKKLLKSMGVKKNVSSPTFIIMIPYKKGPLTFYHMDLYRLNGYKDLEALGVTETWGKKMQFSLSSGEIRSKKIFLLKPFIFTLTLNQIKKISIEKFR